jgi:glutaredoxin
MPDLQHPPAKLTLYTCHVGRGGPSFVPHGCRRAHQALDEAEIEYESVVFGKGRPRALGTTGKRSELKRISGQEQLPVLALPDGTTVIREAAIVAWAAERKPAQTLASGSPTRTKTITRSPGHAHGRVMRSPDS